MTSVHFLCALIRVQAGVTEINTNLEQGVFLRMIKKYLPNVLVEAKVSIKSASLINDCMHVLYPF